MVACHRVHEPPCRLPPDADACHPRLLRAGLTILFVMTFAFVVLRLSGDPALLIMSVDAPPEAIAAFRESWGLNQPIWEQYLSTSAMPSPAISAVGCATGGPPCNFRDGTGAGDPRHHARRHWRQDRARHPARHAALHRNSMADRLTMAAPVAGFPCRASFWRSCWSWCSRFSSAGCRPAAAAVSPPPSADHHAGHRGRRDQRRATRLAMLELAGPVRPTSGPPGQVA